MLHAFDRLTIDGKQVDLSQVSESIDRYLYRDEALSWQLVAAEKYHQILDGDTSLVKSPQRSGPLWDFWTNPAYIAWDDRGGLSDEVAAVLQHGIRLSMSWTFIHRHRPWPMAKLLS